jgi:hypothetical protein
MAESVVRMLLISVYRSFFFLFLLVLCSFSEAPDLQFAVSGTARAAPSSFESPALKRQRTQATDAIADLQRRSALNFGGSISGNGRIEDEFGEDPLDEFTYIAREEEQKLQAAKEKAAQLAAQQKESATTNAANQQAAPSTLGAIPIPHPISAIPTTLSGMSIPLLQPTVVHTRPPPNRPPPDHYKCHTCGLGGHWKQLCPTAIHINAAPGSAIAQQQLSKSRLDKQKELMALLYAPAKGGAIASNTTATSTPGLVFNPAALLPAPSLAAAVAAAASVAASSAGTAAAPVSALPSPSISTTAPELLCTLCSRLFTSPMVVPCCFTSFCSECIHQALILESNRCPRCHKENIQSNQLKPNNVLARRVEKEKLRLGDNQTTN